MADTSVIDGEREQVVRELTRHCGDGRLTLDELEERIEAAYAASTSEDLALLLRDLPAAPAAEAPKAEAPPSRPNPVVTPTVRPPTTHPPHAIHRHRSRKVEGPLGVLITVGGFALLFSGLFWWAMILWFVVPALLKSIQHT